MSINGRQYIHVHPHFLPAAQQLSNVHPSPHYPAPLPNLFTAPASHITAWRCSFAVDVHFQSSRQQLDLCVRLVFSPRQPLVFLSTTTTHTQKHTHTDRQAKSVTQTARQTNSVTHTQTARQGKLTQSHTQAHTHRNAKSVLHIHTNSDKHSLSLFTFAFGSPTPALAHSLSDSVAILLAAF